MREGCLWVRELYLCLGGLAAPWAAWRARSLGSPPSACLAAGPRCQEQSGCGSVSMATRHLEPRAALPRRPAVGRRPSLAAPPGPAASKLGQEAETWWEGLRRGLFIFLEMRGYLASTSFSTGEGRQCEGSVFCPRAALLYISGQGIRNSPGQSRRPSLAQGHL